MMASYWKKVLYFGIYSLLAAALTIPSVAQEKEGTKKENVKKESSEVKKQSYSQRYKERNSAKNYKSRYNSKNYRNSKVQEGREGLRQRRTKIRFSNSYSGAKIGNPRLSNNRRIYIEKSTDESRSSEKADTFHSSRGKRLPIQREKQRTTEQQKKDQQRQQKLNYLMRPPVQMQQFSGRANLNSPTAAYRNRFQAVGIQNATRASLGNRGPLPNNRMQNGRFQRFRQNRNDLLNPNLNNRIYGLNQYTRQVNPNQQPFGLNQQGNSAALRNATQFQFNRNLNRFKSNGFNRTGRSQLAKPRLKSIQQKSNLTKKEKHKE